MPPKGWATKSTRDISGIICTTTTITTTATTTTTTTTNNNNNNNNTKKKKEEDEEEEKKYIKICLQDSCSKNNFGADWDLHTLHAPGTIMYLCRLEPIQWPACTLHSQCSGTIVATWSCTAAFVGYQPESGLSGCEISTKIFIRHRRTQLINTLYPFCLAEWTLSTLLDFKQF